jgi:hypothetical protein
MTFCNVYRNVCYWSLLAYYALASIAIFQKDLRIKPSGAHWPCLQLFDKPWELVEYKYKHSSLFCSVFGEAKKLDCLSLTLFQKYLQVKLLRLQIFD